MHIIDYKPTDTQYYLLVKRFINRIIDRLFDRLCSLIGYNTIISCLQMHIAGW